jgi:hypothetical protein
LINYAISESSLSQQAMQEVAMPCFSSGIAKVPRRWAAVALIAAWLLALPLNVATTHHLVADQTFRGFDILFLGSIGPLDGMFGWYANVLLSAGLMAARRPWRASRVLLTLAAAIVLLVVNTALWRRIPDDSGANPIIALHAGYWLWMATMVAGAAWLAAVGIAFSQSDARLRR